MITKLTLTNFKNFRQAEVSFGPVSLLVGANATGKSNIRDALRFLHGIARGYNLAEIIGEKYGEGGQLLWSGIRGGTREACYCSQTSFSVTVEFERKNNARLTPELFSYQIQVSCGPNGSPPKVIRESLYQNKAMVFDSHPTMFAPAQNDQQLLFVKLAKRASQKKEGSTVNCIALQPVLSQIIHRDPDLQSNRNLLEAVQAVLQELESIRFIDFSPELMRKPSIPGQLILSDRGDNLSSVLQAICEQPELKQALAGWLQELTPMDVVDFEFVPDAAGKILVYLVEEGQRRISANSASDGTLRFLGMLAALLGPKPARFYFLEEIDNGIHPARLALLMSLLESSSKQKGIQVMATTHSPQVLRLVKPEALRFATLAYRLKGEAEGRLKALADIPNLMDAIQQQDLARLHESSWMENAMEFAEGKPQVISQEEAGQP